MTYGEMIRELHRKSGKSVKDYAEAIGYSTAQISNILNDNQKGTLKALLACLKHAEMDIQECLQMPEEDAAARVEIEARRLFRLLDEKQREAVLGLLRSVVPTGPSRRSAVKKRRA